MGFYLGKFVYLMDALEDLPKDRKKRRITICFWDCGGLVFEAARGTQIQEDADGRSGRAQRAHFSGFPILEYAGILRNVLYSGVWGSICSEKKCT